MSVGQQLRLRLFLEGIEVPVIGASIQSSVNSPASASIQVIPTDRILEIKPRTMVHLFHWDTNQDLADPPGSMEGDTSDPTRQLRGYKLSFTGEVVGLVMMKVPNGRQAVLQCADFSTYWDTTYQIFISYSPNGNFLTDSSAMWSGGNAMFDNILSSHSGVMSSYLRRRPKTDGLQDVKGLMGGIISLLEAMGGVPKHVSGVNDFFTIAELKNHILQQITAEQNDDTAQRLFSGKAFAEWLNRGVTSLGELVSFRDMLKLLFHWIYYEVIPISSPMFVKASPPTTTEKITAGRDAGSSLALSAAQRSAIRDWLVITTRYDGSKGLQPTLRNQLATNELLVAKDLAKEIRQFLGGPQGSQQAPLSIQQSDGSTQTIQFDEPPTLPVANIPTRIKKLLDFIDVQSSAVRPPSPQFSSDQILAASLLNNGGGGRGALNEALQDLLANQRTWSTFTENLQDCLEVRSSRAATGPKRKLTKSRAILDRLQSQIFRPDCFFVAPPRCNVLFPDQYVQFQYQRNFLQEITRLRLTTGMQFISGPGAGLLSDHHYAPAISQIREIAKKQGNAGIRTLLPWEKFTGILPKFEHISEVNYIANKRQKETNKNVRGQGASYAQRTANFNFLKYRFAPRTLTVSAKHSPQFVMGFPGLLIDKPFIIDPEAVKQAVAEAGVAGIQDFTISDLMANIGPLARYFRAPTQYLGMPAAVVHNIDQSGGTTQITFTHARTHRLTDDDFLQAWTAEVTKKIQTKIVPTVLDAEQLLREGDYKKLRFLIDATPQNLIETTTDASTIQLLDENGQPLDEADEENDLDLRPNGAPNLARIDQLAPVIFTTPDPGLFEGSRIKVSSIAFSVENDDNLTPQQELIDNEFPGETFVRWIGPTARSTLKGTRTSILEPSPYGKVKPGSPGLQKKGKVSQIQLFSNSVIQVSSTDVDQFARTSKERREIAKNRKRAGKEDSVFMWRKAVIYEEVSTNVDVKPIPVEETIRPPWFSPLYSNLFIGDNIYKPFFGTGSIVDRGLFITPDGGAFFGSSSERDEVIAQVEAADGDSVKIAQVLDEFKAKSLGSVPDIETAVDSLAFLYGEVRRQGLDVQKFIANYTDRPIATLGDMLGTLDLEYEIQGEKLVKIAGEAGFHSTAIAPFGDLLGLVDNPDLELARIQRKGKKFPISRELDPRPGRRAAVQEYADEFGGSQGSLGVGLLG
jgi:hypothetical protein